MDKATYNYYVDWNNNGLYNHASSNISSLVLSSAWRAGRPSDVEFDSAGVISLKLDNSTSIFSSFNAASPIYGLILPGIKVKVAMQIGEAAEVVQAIGYLESVVPIVGNSPGTATSTAELTAHGVIAEFNKGKVDVALQENITEGAAIDLLLDADSFPSADASLDAGISTLSKWWARKDADRLQQMRELATAGLGRLREGKSVPLVYEGRGHIFASPHATPQATYGAGTLNIWNLRQRDPRAGVYDLVRGSARTFNKSDELILATMVDVANGLGGAPILIGAGETKTIEIEVPGPSSPSECIAVQDWGIVDYEVNTLSDGSGTDITNLSPGGVSATRTEYGSKITLVFTNNNASAGYFVLLRAHGVAIVEGDPIPVKSGTGRSEYPYPNPWATNVVDEQARCDYMLARYQNPRPSLMFDVKANYNAAHLAEVQARQNGDRIRVVASLADFGLAIDAEFIIDSLAHTVDQSRIHVMTVSCTQAPASQLAASGTAYASKIISRDGPPDDLYVNAIASGLDVLFGVQPLKFTGPVCEAEFRAKFYATERPTSVDLRTSDEGGSFTDNGSTQRIVTGLGANYAGCQYMLSSDWSPSASGRWYYAWRLRSSTWRNRWGLWSDGNPRPQYVTDWVETEDPALVDSGPPSGFTPVVQPGPVAGSVVVVVNRPTTNGKKILDVTYQIRQANADSPPTDWRAIDADAGAADTIYDGSAVNHTYDKVNGTITKASGNYGSAAAGDLILFDVRDSSVGGWAWDKQQCQWGTITSVSGATISGVFGFRPVFLPTAGVYPGIRIRIVKPPWKWNTEGYLGDQPNHGLCEKEFWSAGLKGDISTATFYSDPIMLPSGVDIADIQARVWFGNMRSRGDNDAHSEYGAGTAGPGASEGCIDLAVVAGEIDTNAALGKSFHIATGGSAITINNPTGLTKCGQVLLWTITGAGAITLGNKFNARGATLTRSASGRDYLGAIYNAAADKLDAWWSKDA